MALDPDQQRELLADYGEAMLEVQIFEWTLLILVSLQEGESTPPGTETNLRRLESLFKLTAGQLRHRVKIEDDDALVALVADTVDLRNRLAHHWLLTTGWSVTTGNMTHEEQREELQLAARSIRGVRAPLLRLCAQRFREKGVDPETYTPDEMRDFWGANFGPPTP